MGIHPIKLPGWLGNKTVFQQGIELEIKGSAAPMATVTLEIVKDPTDGRRVSKLDTDSASSWLLKRLPALKVISLLRYRLIKLLRILIHLFSNALTRLYP